MKYLIRNRNLDISIFHSVFPPELRFFSFEEPEAAVLQRSGSGQQGLKRRVQGI
jgi:hypothetical protein